MVGAKRIAAARPELTAKHQPTNWRISFSSPTTPPLTPDERPSGIPGQIRAPAAFNFASTRSPSAPTDELLSLDPRLSHALFVRKTRGNVRTYLVVDETRYSADDTRAYLPRWLVKIVNELQRIQTRHLKLSPFVPRRRKYLAARHCRRGWWIRVSIRSIREGRRGRHF